MWVGGISGTPSVEPGTGLLPDLEEQTLQGDELEDAPGPSWAGAGCALLRACPGDQRAQCD